MGAARSCLATEPRASASGPQKHPSKLQPQLQVDLPVVSGRASKGTKSSQAPVLSEERRRQVSAGWREVGVVQNIARRNAQSQIVFLSALCAEHAGRRTSAWDATRGHSAAPGAA